MDQVRIAFASTAYGPLWRPVVDSWLRVIAWTQRELHRTGTGEIAATGLTDRMYTQTADNRLINDMLKADPPLTHIFHTEMDMILPDDCVTRLLALDKPVAAGVYFLRNGNGQPCLYRRAVSMPGGSFGMTPVSIYPQTRPFRLKGCAGLGCMLVKREVFETLKPPWFECKEGEYGSDMYFYTNLLKADLEIWIDPLVRPGQIEYKVWGHDDYVNRLQQDPEFAGNGYMIGSDPEGFQDTGA